MKNSYKNVVFPVLIVLFCSGCAGAIRHPVPKGMFTKASVCDMSDIRTIIGAPNPVMQKNLLEALVNDKFNNYETDAAGNKVYPVLALSGGVESGAYGAGLLKGWSGSGSRPKFKAVTGISIGASMAPMAFLGEKYDDLVEEMQTTLSTKDVVSFKIPFLNMLSNSLADNRPLEKQIERFFSDELIAEVAAEHKKGRRLLIGTTLLDAQSLAVWDMGEIAARGNTALFRKIILASGAIPAIFPPVMLNVEVDGKNYDEMHVDGGTISQVFTLYKVLEGIGEIAKKNNIDISKIKAKYYIIHNGYVDTDYKPVREDMKSIIDQSFYAMFNNQGVGDIYKIYTYAKAQGNDYNLAYIPGDFRPKAREMVDPCQMREFFEKGYEDAIHGYKWHKEPPNLNKSE